MPVSAVQKNYSAAADTHEAVTRFPLAWPSGWKRTPPNKRGASSFSKTVHTIIGTERKKHQAQVTGLDAMGRLERQIEELGGEDPVLSTNVRLTLSGRPDTRIEEPADPGVAVYFRFKGRATVLACDRYRRVADNIAAVAAHIDALRRIDRYGVGTIEQALAGYKALPADSAADWRMVMGFPADATPTIEQIQTRYKELAKNVHPDKPNGSDVAFSHLGRAKDFAVQEMSA